MHKFFIEKDQIDEKNIYIIDQDLVHIRNVLRLKIKDKIVASCEGFNYLCEIEDISKDRVKAIILSKEKGSSEPDIDIILYQGLAKGSKMDLIIQKCVEIGVRDFYAIETDRAVVKIKDPKKENTKIDRWQAIAKEAAKQSKRDYVSKIKGILSFDDMIDLLKNEDNIIVPYEDEENLGIKSALKDIKGDKIHLIIGPEGGFEKEEIEALKKINSRIVTLGPRILRTETAGIVASTIILYELSDLGVV